MRSSCEADPALGQPIVSTTVLVYAIFFRPERARPFDGKRLRKNFPSATSLTLHARVVFPQHLRRSQNKRQN